MPVFYNTNSAHVADSHALLYRATALHLTPLHMFHKPCTPGATIAQLQLPAALDHRTSRSATAASAAVTAATHATCAAVEFAVARHSLR